MFGGGNLAVMALAFAGRYGVTISGGIFGVAPGLAQYFIMDEIPTARFCVAQAVVECSNLAHL